MLDLAKMGLTFGFVLTLAMLVVLAMPKSPLRDAIMPFVKLGFAVLCGIYVVSPLDFVPDVLFPVGFADDAAAVYAGYKAVRSAMSTPSAN